MGNRCRTNHMLFLVLFICQMLFGCCGNSYSNIRCIEGERRALLDFKQGLIDKSHRLSSWTGENCCKWEGIGCNIHTGRVVKLDLRNRISLDLERYYSDENYKSYYDNSFLQGGEISPSLLHLEYLQHLDLSTIDFSGIQIPTFFGSFKYMRYLNLSATNFYGEIPNHLGNLSRLQYLDFSGCFLLNSMSSWWISRLSSLKSLDLSTVNLTGTNDWLQATFMLPALQSLSLNGCGLDRIPPLLHVNLTSLVSVDLGGNSFNTSFPLWLFNLSSIENLNLGGNSFQGALPDLFGKLLSLNNFDLSGNNFKSSLPNSLCTLTSLTHINLQENSFLGKLPFCLEDLTSLTSLRLGNNRFQGAIPFEIGHLRKLTELRMPNNELEGTISPTLGQLEKLQSLDISNNSFVGELTELHFAKLTELKSFDISWTSLHINVSSKWFPPFQLLEIVMDCSPVGPRFPPWLETQKSVARLGMSNASISDTIPNWFEVVYSYIDSLDLSFNQISGKPPSIKGARHSGFDFSLTDLSSNKFDGSLNFIPTCIQFIISNNSLTGQIPPLDGNGTGVPLRILFLNDNNFTGNIPTTICNIESLEVLDLSNNSLSGRIPFCLGNLLNLRQLNMANNRLFGQIPGSLGSLGGLAILQLKENEFHGELPLSMQNLTSLQILDLGDNQLSGTLPRWFGKDFRHLVWLRLQSNNLYGDIPLELCQLSSLQMLNLAQNNFTGVIPRCFGNFTAMKSVVFGDDGLPFIETQRQFLPNLIKGRDLEYTVPFVWSVRSIALSDNMLVGEIPKELTDLVELQSLTLSKNHLRGRIPGNIGNLKKLESLDLSMNQLSGAIPPSLATIDALQYLNLSFNKLSGQIPQGNHFQTLDNKSIYEGNRGLCGKPLSDCTDDKPSKEDGPLDRHRGESFHVSWLYAGIGPGFAVGFVGVFSVLLFKKSWRHAYFRFGENLWISTVVKFSLLWRKFK